LKYLFCVLFFLCGCSSNIIKDMPSDYFGYGNCLDKAIYLSEHSKFPSLIQIGYTKAGYLHAEAVYINTIDVDNKKWAIDGKNDIERPVKAISLKEAKEILANNCKIIK
jgi:hypothetical protein